jgi:tRNA pseudouridine38-40 synthase
MAITPEPPRPGGSDASGPDRLRLDVAYDGSGFHGFAENADVRTVAGELRAALERVLRQPVELTCAGRTDTGVHARAQVVSLDVGSHRPDDVQLRTALNGMLGPDIVVRSVGSVPSTFDARFSARWRRYRYRVLASEVPDPFLAATSWWVDEPLDVPAMRTAAQHLVGEHDFSSFCRRPRRQAEVSLVRRVHATGWTDVPGAVTDGTLWCFEIAASAFCHQMVRSIVGALVKVGRGRMSPDQVGALLAARDRSGAPNLAPPQGLTLWEVGYEPWTSGDADRRE